jgi:hypothetical protein
MKSTACRTLFGMILTVWLTGCMPSAAVSWSPDGTRGIYIVCRENQTNKAFAGDGFVIDPAGKILAELGTVNPSWGMQGLTSVAWADDSKSMYFVAVADRTDGQLELARDWSDTTRVHPPYKSESMTGDSVLSVWDRAKATPLVRLSDRLVADLKRSPDGRWIAFTAGHFGDEHAELFAWNVGRKQLFRIDGDVEPNICFTGPHRLAWVRIPDNHFPAELVEATPETDAEKIVPTVLAEVIPGENGFMTPAPPGGKGDGILFLTARKAFPAKPPSKATSAIELASLCRWDRATGDVSVLTDNLYAMTPSPDGKTLLCLASDGDKNWVEFGDPDGTHARHLAEFDAEKIPALPTWHGNDRLTMSAGPGVAGDDGVEIFELTDRPVTPDGKLGPAVVLSKGWDPKRKPWFKKGNFSDVH